MGLVGSILCQVDLSSKGVIFVEVAGLVTIVAIFVC